MQNSLDYFPALLPCKAITLVSHGLNVKPLAMLSIIELLTLNASDVYLVKLSGHHLHSISIKDSTALIWQNEIKKAYAVVKSAAIEKAVPLYFVGYSLGALLGQVTMLALDGDIAFQKQVLFAPATAMRSRAHLLKLALKIDGRIQIPSYTPEPYRANAALPLSVYRILFHTENIFLKSNLSTLNIPSLIFIDPLDELISYRKLNNYLKKFRLFNYQVIPINIDLKNGHAKYHHLIIDELSVGQKNWELMKAKIAEFLF